MSSETSCQIPKVALVEEFSAPQFVNTRAVSWTHLYAPRFGHSNDLTAFLRGTSADQQRDYVKGLIAATVAIGFFFLCWLIFLLVFRCMGPNEVGFFSGKMKPLPPKPSHSSEDWIPWRKMKREADRRLNRIRITVCLCGIAIIASSCMMSIKGIASLTTSLESGTNAIAIVETLANRAINLIDETTEQNSRTASTVDELLLDLNDICPVQRPDGICLDIDDIETCDFDGIFETPIIENTLRHFKEAESSIYFQELVKTRQNLVDFLGLTAELNDQAERFNTAFYMAMIFSLALTVLCVLIIFGMACHSSQIIACLQNCIVMPAFTILVLLSFVSAMTFVIGSLTVADLCYDSPDEKILTLLNRFKEILSPIAVEVASFYINACPAEAIPQEISTQMEFVLETVPMVGDFSSLVLASTSTLQSFCGFNETESVVAAAAIANVQLCEIFDLLDSVRSFFQCENWFPLYDVTMYQAICYNGTDGFAWVSSTQFVLVFFSCVILTLRAAFYEVEIETDEDYDDKSHEGDIPKSDTIPDDESLSPRHPTARIMPNDSTGEWEMEYVQ